jgi:hypothetical protein
MAERQVRFGNGKLAWMQIGTAGNQTRTNEGDET